MSSHHSNGFSDSLNPVQHSIIYSLLSRKSAPSKPVLCTLITSAANSRQI
nr:MAG TPA: hypothetical protein [Caudoviricetes sp.]